MRRLGRDEGMTIVEAMAAAMVLLVGVIGTFTAFDGVRRLGTVSEKKESASRYVQSELESLRALGWTNLRLTAAVSASADSRGIVSGGTYAPPSGTAQPIVLAASGVTCTSSTCVTSGPQTWSTGIASGKIYRYVTCSYADATTTGDCNGKKAEFLRVTVAATIDGSDAPKNAIVASTIVVDPTAAPSYVGTSSNPVSSTTGSTIGAATGTTYYLTDSPVGATYAAPVTDHATRDTISATGVPDQLRTAVPAAPASGSLLPPSYSTDASPGADGGLSIVGTTNCTGTGVTQTHQWATPVLNAAAAVTATGNAALSLPSRSLNPSVAAPGGHLCIDIYSAALAANNTVSSSTLLGTYHYDLPNWPATTDLVTFPFRYLATNTTASIAAGRRLIVRMRTDSDNGNGIIAVYDHPNYPGSIQLETK
ncbi:unannotated protein [freshwater metagenome]|uniref:Unannotated protein n=1 Tax=freshwater metagenome TaxID=449393 RepID=A0A6J7DB72_9ZZZZ|nr:hypothetical protein [Actinomycetota bacterium]